MTDSEDKEPAAKLYPGAGSLMWNFVVAMAIVPLGLFFFSLLGRYYFFAELVCNFRCQIMFMLLPFAIVLIGVKRSWFSFLVFAAMTWSMLGIAWIYLPGMQPEPGTETMRVMSFNLLAVNRRHVEVLQEIKESDPDVLVVLEYSGEWPTVMELLNEDYPHQLKAPRWHGFGVAIFSRYPVSNSKIHQLTKDKTDVPFLVADVQFKDQIIRVAGIHVLSPTNRFRMMLRNDQFREAADILSERQIPTIVAGDYNCVPWSSFLTDFQNRTTYRDSRQGFGYHASWPNSRFWPAQIPIDHAFVSSDIHVHSRVVGEHCGSDHRPIVLDISTKEKDSAASNR